VLGLLDALIDGLIDIEILAEIEALGEMLVEYDGLLDALTDKPQYASNSLIFTVVASVLVILI
jgi:hypothetical protein